MAGLVLALGVAGAAQGQALSGEALTKALQAGGRVLVIRHAKSPQTPPSPAEAEPDNLTHERQLDAAGRQAAIAMGQAIRALRLPLGEVWSSPAYRARQTVTFAALPAVRFVDQLGDGGYSMRGVSPDHVAWLKAKAGEAPKNGSDTVIVTHLPNITAAFGETTADLADGEALVFHPTGAGAPTPIARIKVSDWMAWSAPGS